MQHHADTTSEPYPLLGLPILKPILCTEKLLSKERNVWGVKVRPVGHRYNKGLGNLIIL